MNVTWSEWEQWGTCRTSPGVGRGASSKACGTASITSSVAQDPVLLLALYALHRTRQNLVVLSAQGKKSCVVCFFN